MGVLERVGVAATTTPTERGGTVITAAAVAPGCRREGRG